MARVVTAAELAEHTTSTDCWLAVDGNVYDVTEWLESHPGGAAVLLSSGGTDATEMFNALHQEHALQNVQKHLVGTLEQAAEADSDTPLPAGWSMAPPELEDDDGDGYLDGTTIAAPGMPEVQQRPSNAAAGSSPTIQIVLPDSIAQMSPNQLAAIGAGLASGLGAAAATAPQAAAPTTGGSSKPAGARAQAPVDLQRIINLDQMQAASDAVVDDAVRVWWEHGGEDEETFRANRAVSHRSVSPRTHNRGKEGAMNVCRACISGRIGTTAHAAAQQFRARLTMDWCTHHQSIVVMRVGVVKVRYPPRNSNRCRQPNARDENSGLLNRNAALLLAGLLPHAGAPGWRACNGSGRGDDGHRCV
jgi:predicted heme/steroid binding protein